MPKSKLFNLKDVFYMWLSNQVFSLKYGDPSNKALRGIDHQNIKQFSLSHHLIDKCDLLVI